MDLCSAVAESFSETQELLSIAFLSWFKFVLFSQYNINVQFICLIYDYFFFIIRYVYDIRCALMSIHEVKRIDVIQFNVLMLVGLAVSQ